MKKLALLLAILMVVLNAVVLLPKQKACSAVANHCTPVQRPTIKLTELQPGMVPHLLKS